MSTEILKLSNTGSRGIPLNVIQYSGGKKGICFQITGRMENGWEGYVQLTKKDLDEIYHKVSEEN